MISELLLKPRQFYRNFESVYNHSHVVFLIVAAGIARAFDRAISKSQGDTWELASVIWFSIIIGALLGWMAFYIYAALVSWTSEWIGGKISTREAVGVMAYAAIPMVFSMIFLAVQIALYGNEVFQSEVAYGIEDTHFYIYFGLFLVQALLGLYSFILFVIGLSEIQNIGTGRALLNAFMPVLFLLAIAAVLIVVMSIV